MATKESTRHSLPLVLGDQMDLGASNQILSPNSEEVSITLEGDTGIPLSG